MLWPLLDLTTSPNSLSRMPAGSQAGGRVGAGAAAGPCSTAAQNSCYCQRCAQPQHPRQRRCQHRPPDLWGRRECQHQHCPPELRGRCGQRQHRPPGLQAGRERLTCGCLGLTAAEQGRARPPCLCPPWNQPRPKDRWGRCWWRCGRLQCLGVVGLWCVCGGGGQFTCSVWVYGCGGLYCLCVVVGARAYKGVLAVE